jgi:outer membrane protein TolC
MCRFFKFSISIFMILFSNSISFSESITLVDYLSKSIQLHPLSQKNHLSYLAQLEGLKSVDGLEDWNLFTNVSLAKGLDSQFSSAFNPDGRTTSLSAGASKLFSKSGSRFSVGPSYQSVKNYPEIFSGVDIDDTHSFSFDLSVTQPLLRNAMGKIDRYPLQLKAYEETLAELKYKEDQEALILQLTRQYLEWKLSYTTLQFLEAQFQKASQQQDSISLQYRRGAVEKLDLVLAKQNVKNREVLRLQEQQRFNAITRNLSTYYGDLMGVTPNLKVDSIPYKPYEWANDYISKDSRFEQLLSIEKEMQETTVKYTENSSASTLDLVASTSLKNTDNSLGDITGDPLKNNVITVGITYSKFVKNTAALATEKSAKLQLESLEKSHTNQRENMKTVLVTLYDDLEKLDEMIVSVIELSLLNQEAESLEVEAYNQGRRNSFNTILEAQNRSLGTYIQHASLSFQRAQIKSQVAGLLDLYTTKENTND